MLSKYVGSENGKCDSSKDKHPWGLSELCSLEGPLLRFITTDLQHSHKIRAATQNQEPSTTRESGYLQRKKDFVF